MAIVVSGAAGFVGFHLCERLLEQGENVIGIDNLASGQRGHAAALQEHANFTWLEADISQPIDVQVPVYGGLQPGVPGVAGGF